MPLSVHLALSYDSSTLLRMKFSMMLILETTYEVSSFPRWYSMYCIAKHN